jgi:hypothetical protein
MAALTPDAVESYNVSATLIVFVGGSLLAGVLLSPLLIKHAQLNGVRSVLSPPRRSLAVDCDVAAPAAVDDAAADKTRADRVAVAVLLGVMVLIETPWLWFLLGRNPYAWYAVLRAPVTHIPHARVLMSSVGMLCW